MFRIGSARTLSHNADQSMVVANQMMWNMIVSPGGLDDLLKEVTGKAKPCTINSILDERKSG